jgi:hypothetical protein
VSEQELLGNINLEVSDLDSFLKDNETALGVLGILRSYGIEDEFILDSCLWERNNLDFGNVWVLPISTDYCIIFFDDSSKVVEYFDTGCQNISDILEQLNRCSSDVKRVVGNINNWGKKNVIDIHIQYMQEFKDSLELEPSSRSARWGL